MLSTTLKKGKVFGFFFVFVIKSLHQWTIKYFAIDMLLNLVIKEDVIICNRNIWAARSSVQAIVLKEF